MVYALLAFLLRCPEHYVPYPWERCYNVMVCLSLTHTNKQAQIYREMKKLFELFLLVLDLRYPN